MFSEQQPFKSSAVTHLAFLCKGQSWGQPHPEQVCTPVRVTSSAPRSREFAAPRSVISSLALLTSGFSLPSLSLSSFWSKQADLWVVKSSFPPLLRTLEEEVVSAPRSQEWLRPSLLESLCPFPWKWDWMCGWFGVWGRWLLLRSIWFWLLEGNDLSLLCQVPPPPP